MSCQSAAGVPHLVGEGGDLRGGDVGIERAVADENLRADRARPRPGCDVARVPCTLTTPASAAPGARRLEDGHAAEAVANRAEPAVHGRVCGQPSRPAAARPTSRARSARRSAMVAMMRSRSPATPSPYMSQANAT